MLGTGTTTEYKDECIVDKSKEPTVEGNYKDCTGEDHVADGSTDCCDVDGVIDCCDKDASYVKINNLSFNWFISDRIMTFLISTKIKCTCSNKTNRTVGHIKNKLLKHIYILLFNFLIKVVDVNLDLHWNRNYHNNLGIVVLLDLLVWWTNVPLDWTVQTKMGRKDGKMQE